MILSLCPFKMGDPDHFWRSCARGLFVLDLLSARPFSSIRLQARVLGSRSFPTEIVGQASSSSGILLLS